MPQPGGLTLVLGAERRLADADLALLRGPLDANPRLAATGPLLLGPGGVITGAGGIAWDDGSLTPLDESIPGGRSACLFAAEPDYLPLGPLLLRTEILVRAHAALKQYTSLEYLGAHLCLEARAAGHSVALVPSVQVEGPPAGEATLVDADRAALLGQHAARLARHLPAGARGGLLQGRPQARGWVLVCDQWVPAPDRDSGSARMSALIDLLQRLGHRVTFFSAHEPSREPYETQMQARGVEVQRGLGRFADFCAGRAGLYDRVILSRAHVAQAMIEPVQRYFPDAALVYDTVDLAYLREWRRLELEGEPRGDGYAAMVEGERELQRAADVTVVITEIEAEVVRQSDPTLDVQVVPNIHVLEPAPVAGFDARSGLLFIGGFAHPPNVDAAEHFVADILPLITCEEDLRFFILGSDPPTGVLQLQSPQVVVAGYVADVQPYFTAARVFVAPLRYGAGMKGKVGQAMAYGLPVVTTTIGAEGMGLKDGRDALIADDPLAFAAATARLLTEKDTWERLSRRSRQVVADRWTPAAVAPLVADLMTRCERVRDQKLEANRG